MIVRGSFYVGVYKYSRPGSVSDWKVLFKVACGTIYESQSAIDAIYVSAHKDQIFSSRRETSGYVAFVWLQTGIKKKLYAGILRVMIMDGT